MRALSWSPSFKRAFRRVVRKHPKLRGDIETTLRMLIDDPFAPSLDTHKLKGNLTGLWACSVEFDCRIIFMFEHDENLDQEIILLIDIGSHQEVY